MKNYRDSDYAVNKYSDGIVYRSADRIVEITLEDYLRENPGSTPDDFAELKSLSDEIYLEQVTSECRQTCKNVSLDNLAPNCASVFSVPEDDGEQQRRWDVATAALDRLTDIQRRRYILHHANGLTTREIAKRENVSHVAVVYSLQWSEKKIRKIFDQGKK